MLKVGITGGIGSGKTVVCRLFAMLGVPVIYADEIARRLMDKDPVLVSGIKGLLGEDVYAAGTLDRAKVAALVFSLPGKLHELNALVHPATFRFADEWMAAQKAPYVLKEAAIFFESGGHKMMDLMIGVYAPMEVRMARAMLRGKTTREAVAARMAQQMDEEDKRDLCDFIITNDGQEALIPQVLGLHHILSAKAAIQTSAGH